jgi:hypothetical protein
MDPVEGHICKVPEVKVPVVVVDEEGNVEVKLMGVWWLLMR